MEVLLWIFIFILAVIALVKGADWLLGSAERIGLAFGMAPFIVGVLIVGLGTSFPELVSALFAFFNGVEGFVVANAVGSNIANILLIVGISAIVAKRLSVVKDLINLDIPLLAISTVIFLAMAWDRQIVLVESIMLLAVYVIYLWYTFSNPDDEKISEILPSRVERRGHKSKQVAPTIEAVRKPRSVKKEDVLFLILGAALLFVGAKYMIDSVIAISEILSIATSAIAIAAVALGTSLPELIVSLKAARQNKSEVALGNVFGSNVFNLMGVVGIPGLFGTLVVDDLTFLIGLPVLAVATFVFILTGISKKIHIWEGAMFLILYLFFIGKLFGLF